MRLLIAVLEHSMARHVQQLLYQQAEDWEITIAENGQEALGLAMQESFDLLLLHCCLPELDGLTVLRQLQSAQLVCPPRVLLLAEAEMLTEGLRADCTVPLSAAPPKLCKLLQVLQKKPLPLLAAAHRQQVRSAAECFLDMLCMSPSFKGRAYAGWLLQALVPSPALEQWPLSTLYAACARAYHTTPAAVERCLRVAVECVFTQGSITGIERFFGATVDPEKGKPTNRAFLLQAAQQLRLFLHRGTLLEQQRQAP